MRDRIQAGRSAVEVLTLCGSLGGMDDEQRLEDPLHDGRDAQHWKSTGLGGLDAHRLGPHHEPTSCIGPLTSESSRALRAAPDSIAGSQTMICRLGSAAGHEITVGHRLVTERRRAGRRR